MKFAMIVALFRTELSKTGISFLFDLLCVAGVTVSLLMNGFPDQISFSISCNVGKDCISSSSANCGCVASSDAYYGCEGS
jgi:hypothetical protein